MGFPCRTLAFLKALYISSSARARAGSLLSDPFPVQRGVRQGCPLSGLLFNLFTNDILDGVVPITVPGLPQDTNPHPRTHVRRRCGSLCLTLSNHCWLRRLLSSNGPIGGDAVWCGQVCIISFTGYLAPRLDNHWIFDSMDSWSVVWSHTSTLGVLIDSKLDHSAWLKQKRSALNTPSRLFTQCWLTTS
ncbi:hypothetical protein BASA83_013221 [Batrachochytrium salamandrivorans]|nr:hypothetical protein BASA83_013221 [Batrachochytrium salamandrivorans]